MCCMPFDKCLRVVPSAIFPAFLVYFFSFSAQLSRQKNTPFFLSSWRLFYFCKILGCLAFFVLRNVFFSFRKC